MRVSSVALAVAVWLATAVSGAAQARPPGQCAFGGFGGNPKLAAIGAKTAGYIACSAAGDCTKTSLAAGDTVLVYRVAGDWTCGYITHHDGSGPEWVRTKDMRMLTVDENPPINAWVGNWKYFDNRLTITKGKADGALVLKGEAYWHGGGDNVHTGDVEGAASPKGNKMQYREGIDAEGCVVDLTLMGKYLLLNDNNRCGGMNVRFWGLWKR